MCSPKSIHSRAAIAFCTALIVLAGSARTTFNVTPSFQAHIVRAAVYIDHDEDGGHSGGSMDTNLDHVPD